jgi:DNA-binding FadR family transcriptional regulator
MAIPLSAAEIADDIERRIREREQDFEPGSAMPTYRDLANFYRVGRTTISIAIMLLRDRGVVETKPGRAVYVREDV